jgi:hypothetical protein
MGGAEPRHNLSTVRRLYAEGFLPTIVTSPEDYPYAKDEYLRSLIPQGVSITECNWPHEAEKYIQFARKAIKIPENPLVFGGWKNLYNPARRLLKESEPDFIYSVHGIGAAHLAAMRLKKETGLPWIAEFRDPWVDNVIAWNYMKDNSWSWWYGRELKRTRRVLNEILINADLIVVESTMHREHLIKDFEVDKEKVVPLGMGYEDEYFLEIKTVAVEFPRKPVIGFVGSVYYGYDYAVENLVKSLKDLEDNGFEFTLISIGDSSNLFSRYADRQNLKNFLPISRVDYATALGLMKHLDFGVILGPKSYKLILNSKIWEYLKFDLSVLAIVPEDSMAAEIINEGHCGYILPYNQSDMYQELKTALMEYNNGVSKRSDPDFIEKFSSLRMVDELADRIEALL